MRVSLEAGEITEDMIAVFDFQLPHPFLQDHTPPGHRCNAAAEAMAQ